MKPDPFATEVHKPSDNFKNNSLNLVFRVKYLEKDCKILHEKQIPLWFLSKYCLVFMIFSFMFVQVCAPNENWFNTMSIFFHVRQSESIGQRERDNLFMPGGLLDRCRLDL